MAKKITSGADATLVNVAYRSAMANTPGNYSGTLQAAAKSYGETMAASTKMWKNIGNIVGTIGKDMVENANEFIDYRIKAGGLNPDSYAFLVEDLENNKQAQKDLGLLPGILGDKETRQKKRELKLKQAELFAEIDASVEAINTGADAVANGLYDASLEPMEGEMINAIIKSNLKDPVTAEGHTAVLSRDEKTDQLMFTLMKDGKPVLNSVTSEPRTMTMKEFKKSITTNVDDKGAKAAELGVLSESFYKNGLESQNGVWDPEMQQAALNNLDVLIADNTDLKRAMRAKFGFDNTSFLDNIQKPSALSQDLYNTLLKATGAEGGVLAEGGILEGVKDIDNKPGISKADLQNAENYNILSTAIMGLKDPEVSRAYFKEYTADKLRESFQYGHKKRKIKTDKDGDEDWLGYNTSKNAGSFYLDGETVQYTFGDMRDTADTILNIEKKGKGTFTGYDGNLYVFSKGKWSMMGFDDDGNQITVKDSNKDMMLNNLKFSNKPKILDYLGMNKKWVDHDNLSPTPLQFLNTDWSNPK